MNSLRPAFILKKCPQWNHVEIEQSKRIESPARTYNVQQSGQWLRSLSNHVVSFFIFSVMPSFLFLFSLIKRLWRYRFYNVSTTIVLTLQSFLNCEFQTDFLSTQIWLLKNYTMLFRIFLNPPASGSKLF